MIGQIMAWPHGVLLGVDNSQAVGNFENSLMSDPLQGPATVTYVLTCKIAFFGGKYIRTRLEIQKRHLDGPIVPFAPEPCDWIGRVTLTYRPFRFA